MILLFDIGNTRIKWATFDERGLGSQTAAVHADWNADNVTNTVLAGLPRPDRVLISNVGGSRIGNVVRNAIEKYWQRIPEFMASTSSACDVRNAYPVPENLGVDRWLAVIAAHARKQQLNCVVSVGTAMTIDGVDATGLHLGGVIVPGPALMVTSLLRNTSEIARRATQGSADESLFADNTLGAVQQGAVHALAALVERSFDAMRLAARTEPELILTGGAAALISPLIHREQTAIPDLVLQGLARYAASSQE